MSLLDNNWFGLVESAFHSNTFRRCVAAHDTLPTFTPNWRCSEKLSLPLQHQFHSPVQSLARSLWQVVHNITLPNNCKITPITQVISLAPQAQILDEKTMRLYFCRN